jgi:hypothetical protein
VQKEVLEKYPSLPIQIYSIWFSMLPWDSPLAFPSAQKTMSDPRVTHFWDKEKIAGRWFKENVTPDYQGKVIWDVYYLYGPEAEWGSTPQPLLIWGRTIMGNSQELSQEISRLASGGKISFWRLNPSPLESSPGGEGDSRPRCGAVSWEDIVRLPRFSS